MTISHREPVAAALARVPGRLMVAVPHTDHSEPVERGRADELAVLYEIIHTVTSTLDVEAVLAAIVRLVNDAIVAHATYIFLAEEGGRRIVLRAASERYAHLCGRVSMGAGEGIAGWVLENRQPVFINENVLSDPRVKYFPELEEEKYQSLVSVPLVLKGDRMIGVIALHAEAPRVFSAEDAAFLIHVASLVAQAIENARLYEHTRRSLRELEHLSRLGSAIARAESIDELLASAVEVGRTLVRAESLGVYLVEASGDSLRLRAAAGGDVEGPEVVSLPDLGIELRRNGSPGGASLTSVLAGTLWGAPAMRSALVAPLVAGEEVLGFLVARLADGRRASEHDRDLANSLASQTAVGLKRLQLTDRLAERNRIKDLFDDLATGIGGPALAGRARRLGIDPEAPHLVVWCAPPRDGARTPTAAEEQGFGIAAEALEAAIARLVPGSLADRREDSLRAARAASRHRRERAASSASRRSSTSCRTPSPRASRASARARARSRRAWPRHSRRRSRCPSSVRVRDGCATTSSGSTSTCCASRSTSRCATAAATRCARCATTTGAGSRSCCARSRSSCASGATWPRPRKRCTFTRTRCASACGASPRSPASTRARTTGSCSRSPASSSSSKRSIPRERST